MAYGVSWLMEWRSCLLQNMHLASPMPTGATSRQGTTNTRNPTASDVKCAGWSQTEDHTGNAAAPAAQAQVKMEPADLVSTAHGGLHICEQQSLSRTLR